MCKNNKQFRFIAPIYIGSLLLWTISCSRHLPVTASHSGGEWIGGCCHLDDPCRVKDLGNRVDQLDWSNVDLCKVTNQKTVFCETIDSYDIDQLNALLTYLKRDPVKYPYDKVIYLIAGCGSKKIKGMRMSLLFRSVFKQDLDIIDLLFETLSYYDLNACAQAFFIPFGAGKYTMLHQAVESSNLETVMCLIAHYIETKKKQGVEPSVLSNSLIEVLNIKNAINETPLDLAFGTYHLSFVENSAMIQYLAAYGDPLSQIDLGDKSALYAAAKRGNGTQLPIMIDAIRAGSKKMYDRKDIDMVRKIVNCVDKDGRTLLYYTVLNRNYDAVAYLMALGANCTWFDKNGVSPLFIAIVYGDLHMVQLLLDKKFPANASLQVDINNKGRDGLTPLNFSIKPKQSVVLMPILLLRNKHRRYKVLKNNMDDGWDHVAIGHSNAQIVAALLDAGAHPLIPNNLGQTPLHLAVESNSVCLVELLLEAGSSALLRDCKGYTPLDIAVRQIRVRASKAYDKGHMLSIIVKMLNAAIPIQNIVEAQNCLMRIYREVSSAYQYDNHARLRSLWEVSIAGVFEKYGLSTHITDKLKGTKRRCDAHPGPIDSTKRRKRNSVQDSDSSSSGRIQGAKRVKQYQSNELSFLDMPHAVSVN
ncbi:MAG: ankyrin repeat domain-containing protein [Candidatus Cardinium sp.]|nr:ankyrin repeat domain-containing protein [Candidatus Cardinium sp.]